MLEIWQFQPTFESELILSVPVEQIETARGKIEAILSNDAVIAYARSLQHKNILIASQDFGAYETAEINRTATYADVVERTLTDGTDDEYRSDQLLAYFAGAIVVAPSGLGKTSLSHSMLRQAITARWEDGLRPIPVHVPLKDIALE